MKTNYILPTLFALAIAATSTQAVATGLSYDPYENYYNNYYDLSSISTETQAKAHTKSVSKSRYSNDYSAEDELNDNQTIKILSSVEEADMADPLNYFKW